MLFFTANLAFLGSSSNYSHPWEQSSAKDHPKWGTPIAKVKMVTMLAYAFAIALSLFGNLKLGQMFIRHPLVRLASDRVIRKMAPVDLLWSLFAMPFSVARENNKMMMLGRILCFIFRLVHFSLSTATMTLAFALLDLPQPILRPLTLGTMMIKHLMRVAVIWVLATIVSLPRFIYQNLYLTSLEENIWMPHLPEVLDHDWLVVKIIKVVIIGLYYLVPLALSTKAFLEMTRLQVLAIIAEMPFHEMDDIVPPVPNRRKTLLLLLVLVAVFVISSFPLSFYVALIASADDKTKNAVYFACHWFAMINQRSVQFVYCRLESFENNMRFLVSEGQMSPKVHNPL